MNNQTHLLDVRELKTYFYMFQGVARAVDNVSFFLKRGEILGVVGESGCGKSVMAQSIMKLIPDPPGKIVDGKILFDGMDIVQLPMSRMMSIRGNRISMIFQEPMTSLNPVFTIGNQISEVFALHKKLSRRESWNQAVEMLRKVQIPAPQKRAHEYPHQLSGGMRQRVMIAMALSCNPEILIADEPTTALDVTVQAQILDLMIQLKKDYNTAIIIITHDFGIISEIAQRIVVMYTGMVVEESEITLLFEDPKHPYTRGLLKAIPKLGNRVRGGHRHLQEIKGMVPGLFDLPKGCTFCPRCSEAMDICREKLPELRDVDDGHRVRCWLYP